MTHANAVGGIAHDIIDPILRLRIAASSCFFGEPMYYSPGEKQSNRQSQIDFTYLRRTLGDIMDDSYFEKGLSSTEMMERAIDSALAFDPEKTLLEAVRLRNEDHIRVTPQVMLVRAAHHERTKGTDLVRKYGRSIVSRADEPAVGLAYHFFRYGKQAPIPNSLKGVWKNALEGYSEYEVAKHRLGHNGVKLVDVVNLVHPKGEVIGKLCRGELSNKDRTWEAIISAEGSNKRSWEKAFNVMGHMALLRNLRNLLKNGLDKDVVAEKLVKGAAGGRQLPFRYYSAFLELSKSHSGVLDAALEEALKLSIGGLPRFPGKLIALSDNSGSATGTFTSSMGTMCIATIANLTSIIAARCADEGYIGVFGDHLHVEEVEKERPIFEYLHAICSLGDAQGGNTENGIWLFWDQAIQNKEHWDTVFIFSDMQAGHGGLYGYSVPEDYLWHKHASNSDSYYEYIDVPHLIKKYRAEVNPNVNVFMVQVAGYQNTIIPEFYDRTYILGGWGDGILKFAHRMVTLRGP